MSSPEVLKPSGEHGVEAQNAAGERLKELQENLEKKSEQKENRGERAAEARKATEAVFAKEAGKERSQGGEPSAPSLAHASKKQRQASYQRTMRQIQSEMSGAERTFSKIIHNRAIEKTSDVIGSTVARPNAILSGSVCATFLTLAVFLVARYYGYPLSGFESIGAFIAGWVIGVLYDYFQILFTGKVS